MYVIMPRLSNLALVPVLALLLLAGCKKEDSLLSGPIPSCERLGEMQNPEMKAYRVAAYKDCAKANTLQEKMNSVGCDVKNKIGNCSSIPILEITKEEKEILSQLD